MSPELFAAVSERIKIGRTQSEIVAELVAAGYATEVAEAAYQVASAPTATSQSEPASYAPVYVTGDTSQAEVVPSQATSYTAPSSTSLIGFGQLLSGATHLVLDQGKIFLYSIGITVMIFLITIVLPVFINMQTNSTPMLVIPPISLLFFILTPVVYATSVRAFLFRLSDETYFSHLVFVLKNLLPLSLSLFLITLIFVKFGVQSLILFIPGLIVQFILLFAVSILLLGQTHSILLALKLSYKILRSQLFGVFGKLMVVYFIGYLIFLAFFSLIEPALITNLHISNHLLLSPSLQAIALISFVIVWFLGAFVLLLESLLSLPRERNFFSK